MEYKKINMPGLLHGGDYNPEQWLDRIFLKRISG